MLHRALLVLLALSAACNAPKKSGGDDTDLDDTDAADTDVVDTDVADTDVVDTDAPDDVVDLDFEVDLPANVDPDACTLTPSQGYEPLGPAGNQFGPTFLRCLTGNVITVTLTDLPEHTSLSLDFLFAAIDSLDGTGDWPAGDYFRIDLDGTTIFRESFANATESQVQSYTPPVPEIVLARRVDLGFSGPGGYFTDSAYDMSLDPVFDDLPHTGSTATLVFSLEGAGVQSLDDESWAIDNLRVTVGHSPRATDTDAP